MNLQQIADRLDQAATQRQSIAQLHLQNTIGLKEAYEVQNLLVQNRLARGERITGVKMGFTSEAKRVQMGVKDLIWGRLTDKMEVPKGGKLNLGSFIHPRVEPEIAFKVNQRMDKAISLENAGNFIDGIALALEIIDSRYENFKFSLEDVVADNCSSAAYVIGDWVSSDMAIPLLTEIIVLEIDGNVVHDGPSTAIMGNPLQSLVDAVRLSLENGLILEKGSIVLAGAVTPAVYLQPNQKIVCRSEIMPNAILYT